MVKIGSVSRPAPPPPSISTSQEKTNLSPQTQSSPLKTDAPQKLHQTEFVANKEASFLDKAEEILKSSISRGIGEPLDQKDKMTTESIQPEARAREVKR